jgi:hypothetical protein
VNANVRKGALLDRTDAGACVAAVARRPTSLLAGYAFQSRPQQPKIPNERKIKANQALFSGHKRKVTEM